ncbi:hypothetical protein [Rhodanobacter ginsengiterrae]|uniref:hypothetical protein n=1 Tax=Rhodanobacter ginsengiterrae TaxID=2008451 RepID=UPI003CE9F445
MPMLTSGIPFAGFYGSQHDAELDYAMEAMFSNDQGDPNRGLTDRVSSTCHWSAVRRVYAKEYAESFCEEVGIRHARFESMDSPKFYNFETDRVFMELPLEEVQRLMRETSTASLDQVAAERHTCRSGFISFYSPDWRTWGDAMCWDHNQLQTLLEAYVRDTHGELEEASLMGSTRGNGRMEDWIADNTPGIDRLYRIHDYLRAREACARVNPI